MYTLEEIKELRQKCVELKLAGYDKLKEYSDEELRVICNGIGPDAFPRGLRAVVTAIHPTLEAAAMIHDVEYEESDGTRLHFTEANDRYAENGCRLAEAEYGWYNPLRYVVKLQALRHARLCQLGGWSGYLEQGDRNRNV